MTMVFDDDDDDDEDDEEEVARVERRGRAVRFAPPLAPPGGT